ncbi:MAG: hypothetical protein HOP29_13795 [Phycisphaerales bacterium]|nr:hypothetical protein [Phycisphaerales bacterium]
MVNGRTITVDDVLQPVRADLLKRSQSMPADQYADYLMAAVRDRTRLLARDTMIYQEASKNITESEQQQVDRMVDQQIREQVNAEFDGRQTRFEKALADQNTSLERERDRIRRELTISRWLRMTIVPRIADPTRDELWKVFEGRRDELAAPERRQMQLIEISVLSQLSDGVTVPNDDQAAAARAAARRHADALRAQLVAGADFAELARTHSRDIHAKQGGQWGWVTRGSLRARYEPAVEALYALPSTSDISHVIEIPDAFFIVRASQIEPAREPDFAAVQPQLIDHYRDARFNELVDEQIQKMQASAEIRPANINLFVQAVINAAPQPLETP